MKVGDVTQILYKIESPKPSFLSGGVQIPDEWAETIIINKTLNN